MPRRSRRKAAPRFNREGDCLAAKLRPGNVHSAGDWEELLLPEIERQQKRGKEVVFRAEAAFAKPEIYEALEKRGVTYAIRIPSNDSLERDNRGVVDAASRQTEPQARGPVQKLSLPGSQLENGAAGGMFMTSWRMCPTMPDHRLRARHCRFWTGVAGRSVDWGWRRPTDEACQIRMEEPASWT